MRKDEDKGEDQKNEEELQREVTSAQLERLKGELEEKTKLADEYVTRLKYLQADFENYKKMAARERKMYETCATEQLIKNLLPILDNFEAALAAAMARQGDDLPSFVKGIELIYKDLLAVLEKEGLKPIKAVGEKFDPFKHEALTRVQNSEVEEDVVVEEFQKGYTFNSKVIRTSKVIVSKR